jgi:hypothetical protein
MREEFKSYGPQPKLKPWIQVLNREKVTVNS